MPSDSRQGGWAPATAHPSLRKEPPRLPCTEVETEVQPGEAPPGAAQLGRGREDRLTHWELRALAITSPQGTLCTPHPEATAPRQRLTRFSGGTLQERRREADPRRAPPQPRAARGQGPGRSAASRSGLACPRAPQCGCAGSGSSSGQRGPRLPPPPPHSRDFSVWPPPP